MRDPVFSGKDVADAVRLASRTLALPEASLRYVVLERGQAGGRGLSSTEARIAILLEKPGPPGKAESATIEQDEERAGRRRRREERPEAEPAETTDVVTGIRELLRQFARAAESEIQVEVSEGRDTVEVRLDGTGVAVLYDERGDTIASLEHLVERIYGRELSPRRVRVRCEGYREYRDEMLRQRAHDLALEVLADGEARTTEPLNSYERRLIHVAVEGQPGLVTYSVGEGSGRRVTIARVEPVESATPDATPTATLPAPPPSE
jgi:spoIIIJ-associated protein